MSTTVGRELHLTYENANTYLSCDDSNCSIGYYHSTYKYTVFMKGGTSDTTINLKSAANNVLYPNSVAHPTSAKIEYYYACATIYGTSTINTYFGSTNVWSTSKKSKVSPDWHFITTTSSAVLNSTKSTALKLVVGNSSSLSANYVSSGEDGTSYGARITLYFTRYDFSATAGTGVASASVSSATGFDGDSITFNCTLQSGATFKGWYKNGTLVSTSQSYTVTVNGADMALTAVAEVASGTVNITYNGSTIASFSSSSSVSVTYNGSTIATLSKGSSKTISCSGCVMASNLGVGDKTLACSGKVMNGNVVINYS